MIWFFNIMNISFPLLILSQYEILTDKNQHKAKSQKSIQADFIVNEVSTTAWNYFTTWRNPSQFLWSNSLAVPCLALMNGTTEGQMELSMEVQVTECMNKTTGISKYYWRQWMKSCLITFLMIFGRGKENKIAFFRPLKPSSCTGKWQTNAHSGGCRPSPARLWK